MFEVNADLIASARAVLKDRSNLYWLIGGAASGKSALCSAIAERTGITIYGMDERIYGSYGPRYTAERHPANTEWRAAENPLAWSLNLTAEAFDAFNRAATAEYLDLLAADLAATLPDQPILIDGGITHPSVIAQVLPARQILCVCTNDAERVQVWEHAPERAEMRRWIAALAEPGHMWRRFLDCDTAITTTIRNESLAAQIPLLFRRTYDPIDCLVDQILGYFKIPSGSLSAA
ncbi:MAG: hypothetical protein HC822_12975 [Oscillochloris sp.]|nr:hypothetical protein [Oscillochloris sp.]